MCGNAIGSDNYALMDSAQLLLLNLPICPSTRPISAGLIKYIWIMPLHPKTSEMEKKQERKVKLPGIKPRAIGIPYQCSATKLHLPPATMIQRSSIWPGLIGLWAKIIGVPTIGLPGVIPLRFSIWWCRIHVITFIKWPFSHSKSWSCNLQAKEGVGSNPFIGTPIIFFPVDLLSSFSLSLGCLLAPCKNITHFLHIPTHPSHFLPHQHTHIIHHHHKPQTPPHTASCNAYLCTPVNE